MPPKRISMPRPPIVLPPRTQDINSLLARVEKEMHEEAAAVRNRRGVDFVPNLSEMARAEFREQQRRRLEQLALEYPDEQDIGKLNRISYCVTMTVELKRM